MSTPIGRTGLSRITPALASAAVVAASAAKAAFFDDFLGDVLADQWNLVEGTDAATSDAAILAGGIGGVMRLTTGDAGTGLAADQVQVTMALQWQASNGGLSAETRVKFSQITDAYFFFGFTDQAATLEGPVVSAGSANTITTNASDAVGFMFDTRMTTDNLWLVGVKGDIDATAQDSGVAPVAAQYMTLRVDVDASGTAAFFINGLGVGTTMANAVTAATDLTPVITASKTATATSMTVDTDYIAVSMDRAGNGSAV